MVLRARHEQKLDSLICDRLGLEGTPTDVSPWRDLVNGIISPKGEVEIAVVGKYIALHDAYKSVYEALSHGGVGNECHVDVRRIQAEDLVDEGVGLLEGVDGVLVPGGFGERGLEGKIAAVRWARERGVPYFGICLGMQCAVIEYARNVVGIEGAHHARALARRRAPRHPPDGVPGRRHGEGAGRCGSAPTTARSRRGRWPTSSTA